MKIEKNEENIEVVIVGKEELQEGVAATGTAVDDLEYLLENCGFMKKSGSILHVFLSAFILT